jgi:hypothetical protein
MASNLLIVQHQQELVPVNQGTVGGVDSQPGDPAGRRQYGWPPPPRGQQNRGGDDADGEARNLGQSRRRADQDQGGNSPPASIARQDLVNQQHRQQQQRRQQGLALDFASQEHGHRCAGQDEGTDHRRHLADQAAAQDVQKDDGEGAENDRHRPDHPRGHVGQLARPHQPRVTNDHQAEQGRMVQPWMNDGIGGAVGD